ncbi:MAG: hypothetical protein J6K81_04910 [Rikenellaceae bacterium]|nr:hypothetical protein [Rikenellaceae bacterium]
MKNIDDEIYNMLDGAIVRRRKSVVIPTALFVVGLAAFVGGFVATHEDLSFGLMLCGVIIALSGGAMILMRTTGTNYAPYYTPSGEHMRRTESYYPNAKLESLREALAARRHPEAWGVQSVESSNVMLVCYEAPKSGVRVCQIMTYVPHEYRPSSDVVVLDK